MDKTPESKNKDDLPNAKADRQPADDPLIDKVLGGKYQIIDLLGSGAWANVYRARHLTLDSQFAVKVIHPHLAQDENGRRRMAQEASLLSKIDSDHVVRVIDYGASPSPYIVMELFDGIPLDAYLQENGAMKPEHALELFSQLCSALENAHSRGLVHRDLKPSNILVELKSNMLAVKVLDFGIAKLLNEAAGQEKITSTGEVVGSPPYMPPEQWTGRSDHRSDYYSLACIMYEVLTGKQAFNAPNGIAYLIKHNSERPISFAEAAPSVQFPKGLEEIVFKCLEKSPKDRYQSVSDLQNDLSRLAAGRFVRPVKESSKKINRIFLATLLAAITLASLGYANKELLLKTFSAASRTSTPQAANQEIQGDNYNLNAIYSVGTAFGNNGIDGKGRALDAEMMGSELDFDGTKMFFGKPGKENAWTSTLVPIKGAGKTIKIVGFGLNGYQKAQTFTVNYSDGSSSKFTQNLSDWLSPSNFEGEYNIFSAHYGIQRQGFEWRRRIYVYGYEFPLEEGKKPVSLALPSNKEVVILSCSTSEKIIDKKAPRLLGCKRADLVYSARCGDHMYTELRPRRGNPTSIYIVGISTAWIALQLQENGRLRALLQVQERENDSPPERPDLTPPNLQVAVLHKAPSARLVRVTFSRALSSCNGFYDFEGKMDQWYKVLLKSEVKSGRTIYSFYLASPPKYQWIKIAAVSTPLIFENSQCNSGVVDYKWDNQTGKQTTCVDYRNGWVRSLDKKWIPLDKAKFQPSYEEGQPGLNIDAFVEKNYCEIVSGGSTNNKNIKAESEFSIKSHPLVPPQLPTD